MSQTLPFQRFKKVNRTTFLSPFKYLYLVGKTSNTRINVLQIVGFFTDNSIDNTVNQTKWLV